MSPAMPIPRVRFTIRRLMVAVAVVALILCFVIEDRRRRNRYNAVFEHHKRLAAEAPHVWRGGSRRYGGPDGYPYRLGGYHADLRDKYREAAAHPWRPIEPDPPPPPWDENETDRHPAARTPWLPVAPDPSEPG